MTLLICALPFEVEWANMTSNPIQFRVVMDLCLSINRTSTPLPQHLMLNILSIIPQHHGFVRAVKICLVPTMLTSVRLTLFRDPASPQKHCKIPFRSDRKGCSDLGWLENTRDKTDKSPIKAKAQVGL